MKDGGWRNSEVESFDRHPPSAIRYPSLKAFAGSFL
jgi:hypothetical protein